MNAEGRVGRLCYHFITFPVKNIILGFTQRGNNRQEGFLGDDDRRNSLRLGDAVPASAITRLEPRAAALGLQLRAS